ncbi:MAG TPA: hypothetical protein VH134_13720 [Candidatus Dormibacteraeota bacterium]|nr:hypothetical protein [Candidatus Dormibacteraeota bacterium]
MYQFARPAAESGEPTPDPAEERRREERRVQGDEGRGQDPGYDPQRPEEPGDPSTAR